MAGISTTIRRLAHPPGEIGKTHYEYVAEWACQRIGYPPGEESLDPALRCRLGETMHFTFGGLGGIALALASRRLKRGPTAAAGLGLGTTMWIAAFGGYMPKLGITGGLRDWGNYERFRTFAAHAAYGTTSGLVLRALQRDAGE